MQAGQILAAAAFLPLSYLMPSDAFMNWGWRIPLLLSALVLAAAYVIRRDIEETPVFLREAGRRELPRAPILEAVRHSWPDMLRVICMAAMNVIPVVATIFGAAYAVQPAYGIGFSPGTYLLIPVLGNVLAVAVIPLVGRLSDRIGRRLPIILGALGAGLLSFAYLYAISRHDVVLAVILSLLMWGVIHQGHNAVFPSYFAELFQARHRVSATANSLNIGVTASALLPAVFASVAPPGSSNVPLTVGTIAFGVTVSAALAALSARETYRVRMDDLGHLDAAPVSREGDVAMRTGPRHGAQQLS